MESILLKNAEDSIKHALSHLLEDDALSSFHHRKWFLFSVYHASQMIFLHLMEKKVPGFCAKNRYPTLNENLLKEIKKYYVEEAYLKHLFVLLSINLKNDRDIIWHRDATHSLESLNQEVFSLMGIMQYCALQERRDVREIFDLKTDDLQLISESISLQEVKLFDQYKNKQKSGKDAFQYEDFISDLFKHKFPNKPLYDCFYCGAYSILDDSIECEACFKTVTWFKCEKCGDRDYKVENITYHQCSKTPICRNESN